MTITLAYNRITSYSHIVYSLYIQRNQNIILTENIEKDHILVKSYLQTKSLIFMVKFQAQ